MWFRYFAAVLPVCFLALSTAALAATFNGQVVSTTNPEDSSGCNPPPPVTSFVTTNNTVYLYFNATTTLSDQLTNDWLAPDGSVVQGTNWTPVSGTYCFTGASLSITNTPANLLGAWQARVYDNGRILFMVGFTVSAPAMTNSGSVITTVAGTSRVFPSQPLPSLEAPLNEPSGVVVDAAGNVYVSDASNQIVFRIAQDGALSVVAGNGIAGYSGDGGPGTQAALSAPEGLAVDAAGDLYIADLKNNRIRKVSNGIITTVAGNGTPGFSGDGGPATSAELFAPAAVAVDSAGNLYISDKGNSRIRKVSGGVITTVAGNGGYGFSGDGGLATSARIANAFGIAVDSMGDLFIADSDNNRVREVSASGVIKTVAGTGVAGSAGDSGPPANAQLYQPRGVAIDAAGNLYIADYFNSRIREISGGMITTVAGTGSYGFSGDNGPAPKAKLSYPWDVAADVLGNIYIADAKNGRVRKLSSGTITTVAGNGALDSGDGGPAAVAYLNSPEAVATDSDGNVYIAEPFGSRVREVSKSGIVTTVAGNGTFGFSGDGGAAADAELSFPFGIAVDSAGNLYIADAGNHRVRKISGGTITTVAGSGTGGFAGDGGSATNAQLSFPVGVTVDSAGNLYIADQGNNRVRKVSGGTITTVAGNGTAGFAGDGGPATSAELSFYNTDVLATDSAGNLYIADTYNNRIREVSGGIITTVAGNGAYPFAGDGGLATSAQLDFPTGAVVGPDGSLYIADQIDNRVRQVSNGIIETVAGNGIGAYSGDGGPSQSASLSEPAALALDSAGDLYIVDFDNNRIREVLAAVPSLTASPLNLTFAALSGGLAPAPQTINVSSPLTGLVFSVSASDPWISVTPLSGSAPAVLQVSVDPSQLTAKTYAGSITITTPGAPAQTINVAFNVGQVTPGKLGVSATSLSFSLTQGAGAANQQLTVSNQGSGSILFTAAVGVGGNWLQVRPGSGTLTPSSPVSLTVTVNPGSLGPGTFSGKVVISSTTTGESAPVSVTLAITAAPQKILLSQTGLSFTAVSLGGNPLPQSFGILNAGLGTMNWTASVSTLSGGPNWLSIDQGNGAVANLDVSPVNVSVDASGLSPGDYYGEIQVKSAGAANSPQSISVALSVLKPGSTPGPEVRPSGLIFIGRPGASPGSQNVLVSNPQSNDITFGGAFFTVPTGGSWLNFLPSNATVEPNSPVQMVMQPDYTNLAAGVYQGFVSLGFVDGSTRTVNVLAVVAPNAGRASLSADGAALGYGKQSTAGCAPTKLNVVFTQIGSGSSVPAGWPATISAKAVDDCGNPMVTGSVTASFTNGDPPLSLVSLQDGNWEGTWKPGSPNASNVGIQLQAKIPELNLSGTTQSSIGLEGNETAPVLSGDPLSAAALTQGPIAPGDLIVIRGTNLADAQATANSAPPGPQLAGASVAIGGVLAPLLYADASRLLAMVPTSLAVNSSQGLLLQRDVSLGVPAPVIISATHPGILTQDGSGQGQGLIYKTGSGATILLADASHPAMPGDSILVYCTGLGVTDQSGNASIPPSVMIGGQAANVSYAGVALAKDYPASGPPALLGGVASAGLGGLYEIVATVPGGVGDGPQAVYVMAGGRSSQDGVTMIIGSGGGSTTNQPVISSIDTAGGSLEIAQNDWIEIKGSNLAPASVGANGMTWNDAPDFKSGMLPAQLGNVSVTVNGKPAFIYYISANQINALTPLDNTIGPVQVVVTVSGVPSQSFSVTLGAAAPSFLLFGATRDIAATHADGRLLVGPSQLSAPGYPFLPAQPGETITLYCVGFGLPSSPLVNGSSAQSGTLPSLPDIRIGGADAVVTFAGVVGPGLYQLNVTIPNSAQSGDNAVVATYDGLTTPAGDVLNIQ